MYKICKHNLDDFNENPKFIIIGIKYSDVRCLPPIYDNVIEVAYDKPDLYEKIKNLIRFKVFSLGKQHESMDIILKEAKDYFNSLIEKEELKQLEMLTKKYK